MRAGKHNFAEVAVYAAILALLLGWRARQFMKKKGLQPLPRMAGQLSDL